jgi:hypothetical protein
MKIESFADLIQLSYQFHELTLINENLLCKDYKSLDENPHIVNILYKQLNEIQKQCFENIHCDISSRSYSITLLDSRPGTGKSHLMATFGMSCKLNILFVVYKQELVDYMNQIPYWDCYTAAKFKVKLFQLNSYKNFFSKFATPNPTTDDILARIFVLTKMINQEFIDEYDVFIIDEYTVLNPEMVLAFCFMGIVYNKHVLFSGDRCQQNSIDKSSQSLGASNYYLVKAIASRSVSLTRSVRCTDDAYNAKLDEFRSLLETSGNGSTPMNYFYGFKLYELFREKFYKDNVFENGCYFAIHHKMLTIYTKKFKEHLLLTGIKFGMSHIQNDTGDFVVPEHDEKFFYSLILVPGMMYIFNKKKDPKIQCGQYKLREYAEDSLIIQDPLTSKRYTIRRTRLYGENILDTLYDRLCTKFKGALYQFPLSPLYTSTYHNAQGLTIQSHIDLNVSRATCESVYVGLSRIKLERQLNKLEYDAVHLRSFEFTHNRNDDYVYFVNDPDDTHHFKEVTKFNIKSKKNQKMKKCLMVCNKPDNIPPIVHASEYINNNTAMCLQKYQEFSLPNSADNLKSNLGYLLS